MTVGVASGTANSYLNTLRATAYTSPTSVYLKMHTADPGSAGTTAASTNTTNSGKSSVVVWSAASAGSMAYSSGGLFSAVAGISGSEVITHLSLWNTTGDVFLWSVALSSSKTISNGDTLQVTALTLAFTPIAA